MIKGKLITIRNVREKDLETLYSLSVDMRDAGEYMPSSFISESAYRGDFRDTGFWSDDSGKLIIEESESSDIVGEIGFFKGAHYLDGREIYYRIFSGARGKGFASEAVKLVVKYFFEATSMNRIQAVTVEGNSESEHILSKNGFKPEGKMRQARWFHGKIVDLNMFSFLRGDLHSKD